MTMGSKMTKQEAYELIDVSSAATCVSTEPCRQLLSSWWFQLGVLAEAGAGQVVGLDDHGKVDYEALVRKIHQVAAHHAVHELKQGVL